MGVLEPPFRVCAWPDFLSELEESSRTRAAHVSRRNDYPCQTCFPQAQCTVSVGIFLVSCCLQTGQGFVITYVITLRLLMGTYLIKCYARQLPQNRLSERRSSTMARLHALRPDDVSATSGYTHISVNSATRSLS